MSILLVHLVDHALGIAKLIVEELHSVPCVVGAPVLPVLDDAVERYAQFAVAAHHLEQFALTLVALAALVETIGPQGKHGHLTCEVTHLGNHAIGIAAIYEIVVNGRAHLALEHHLSTHALVGGDESGGRVVVPIDAVSLDALEHVGIVLEVALLHAAVFATLRHLAILQEAYAIDTLIGIDHEGLLHLELALVGTLLDGCEGPCALRGDDGTLVVGKGHLAILDRHGEGRAAVYLGTVFDAFLDLHLARLGDYY